MSIRDPTTGNNYILDYSNLELDSSDPLDRFYRVDGLIDQDYIDSLFEDLPAEFYSRVRHISYNGSTDLFERLVANAENRLRGVPNLSIYIDGSMPGDLDQESPTYGYENNIAVSADAYERGDFDELGRSFFHSLNKVIFNEETAQTFDEVANKTKSIEELFHAGLEPSEAYMYTSNLEEYISLAKGAHYGWRTDLLAQELNYYDDPDELKSSYPEEVVERAFKDQDLEFKLKKIGYDFFRNFSI